jgi:hypothetical protein
LSDRSKCDLHWARETLKLSLGFRRYLFTFTCRTMI